MYIFGIKGNCHYLLDNTTKDCIKFDSSGSVISKKVSISECRSFKEVSVISVVGKQSIDDCEVFIDGNTFIVKEKILYTINILKNKLQLESHIVYRLKHNMGDELVNQFIMLVPRGIYSIDMLRSLLTN